MATARLRQPPTSGSLFLDDSRISLRSVRHASSLGIGIIHQELNLCPNLSVAENIFLACEQTVRGALDTRRQQEHSRELLARLRAVTRRVRNAHDEPETSSR